MRTFPLKLLKLISTIAAVLWVTQARAQAETKLVYGEQHVITASLLHELLGILNILPSLSHTETKVSATGNGGWTNSVTFPNTGGMSCSAASGTNASVTLQAGNTAASATCHVQVCTYLVLQLIPVCYTTDFPMRALECVDSTNGEIDNGCSAEAPACTGGSNPTCVGCTVDRDCETTERRFGLGLGEVARVGVNLLTRLLGIDLGLNLTQVTVGADVNGPFSDEAILETGASCRLGSDGSVELIGSETMAGESTCFVKICVPLLNICPIIDLSIVTDGCLLSGNCGSVASCDVASNTCLACQDTKGPGQVDSGCTTLTPACLGQGDEAECVECTTHEDCQNRALALNIAPTQSLNLPLTDVLRVLNVLPSLIPSTVKVGADLNGPFSDEALLGAGAEVSSCAVDANGNINVLAAAIEGEVTCYVEVCLNLLGNTVATCLKTAIDINIDVCVLDDSCELLNTCNAQNTCGGCVDSAPTGERDLGCNSTTPICLATSNDSTCVECTVDEDCVQSRPLLDLDLGEVGVITRNLLLSRLDLVLNLLQIDSLQVAASIDGPFADTTTLAINGDIASCRINVEGDVELVAQANVYGVVTCYAQLCVNALDLLNTCVVVPLEVNVAPCARTNSCGEQICDLDNTCATCRDIGDGVVDPGCSSALPACLAGSNNNTQICVECTADADCAGDEYCSADNTCKTDFCKDPDCVRDQCDETAGCLMAVRPDHLLTHEDTAILADLLANDEVLEGNSLTVTQVSTPVWGQVSIREDGLITYTPPQDFYGFDSFTYTACDTRNVCGESQVTVQVLPVNDPPNAVDDYSHTPIGTPVVIPVLDNDGDIDSDVLFIAELQANVAGVSLSIENDQISAIPAEGFAGDITFTYTVCDEGNLCDTATVNLRVGGTPVENPVLALDDLASTSGYAPITIDVLANDVHALGEPLFVAAATGPRHGAISIQNNKIVYYPVDPSLRTPMNNLPTSGEDSFTYTAADANGHSAVAMVRVIRSPLGTGPTAVPDEVSTLMNQAVTFYPTTNDFDPNGSALRVVRFVAPRHGTVMLDSTTSALTYLPATGFLGTESFLVVIANEQGQEAAASAYVHVRATGNEAPIAVDDTFEVEGYLTGNTEPTYTFDILGNDSDPNGDSLTVLFVTGNGVERLSILNDGRISYRPAPDFAGEEVFTYTITDGFGARASADILIKVQTEGISPVAVGDAIETDEDVPALIDVLANDSSPRGLALSARLHTAPASGVVEVLADNTLRYTPNANYNGTDTFIYEACDTQNACAQAAVNVVVRPVDDAPTAVDDHVTTPVNTAVTMAPLANDYDVDGDAITLTSVGMHASLTIVQLADQRLTITPATDFVGEASVPYTICDTTQLCSNATITVVVGGTSEAPIAVDDRATVNLGGSILIDVLANDISPSGDSLNITSLQAPSVGTAALEANQVRFNAPVADFGDVTFSYSVCTPSSACSSALITVTVLAPANNAPIAIHDTVRLTSLSATRIHVLANDRDPDGDALRIEDVGSTVTGDVAIDGEYVIYTPRSLTATSFSYTVCDVHNACSQARVSVLAPNPEDLYALTGGPSDCNSASGALWASLLGLGLLAVRKRKLQI